MTMSAPASARPRAIALPRPLLPPVTSAVLPVSLNKFSYMLLIPRCKRSLDPSCVAEDPACAFDPQKSKAQDCSRKLQLATGSRRLKPATTAFQCLRISKQILGRQFIDIPRRFPEKDRMESAADEFLKTVLRSGLLTKA